VGCRESLAKRSLIRIVRGTDGVRVDPTGKAPGRGAYIHDRRSCWEEALRGSLERALKTELNATERQALEEHMRTLASEEGVGSIPATKDKGEKR
jgi:predicted RNA-binding protein YlxR (DUF448 family)